MAHRIFINVLAIALVVFLVPSASAITGVPDLDLSFAIFYALPQPIPDPVMFNIPDGSGAAFTDARNLDGPVDATIALYLRDNNDIPITNFPVEDMWLYSVEEYAGQELWTHCVGGTIPEFNTDVNGETTWISPISAGGWSEGPTGVMINGAPLSSGDLNLRHNSPDINGDLIVNLVDLSAFAIDYFGYSFQSDFYYDGIMTLQDLALFALGYNAECP